MRILTTPSPRYDTDTDPQRRRKNPAFYGYVPDLPLWRTLMFFTLLSHCSMLLLIRSISAALLMTVSLRYFVGYYITEMILYISFKIARRDMYYHMPVEGPAGICLALIARPGVKLINDFIGLVHMRSAQELGGIAWSLNLLVTLAMSIIAVNVYYAKVDVNEEFDASVSVLGLTSGMGNLVYVMVRTGRVRAGERAKQPGGRAAWRPSEASPTWWPSEAAWRPSEAVWRPSEASPTWLP
jgi:hypothetical protein